MNLLGIKKIGKEQLLTLDKVNRSIRAEAKNNNLNVSIMQSHNEAKVVSYIQKNRTKLNHIIIAPGPWSKSGFVLKDILDIIGVPFSIILDNDDETIYHPMIDKSCIHVSSNYIDAYIESIKSL